MIRIIIADDHAMVREGLKRTIGQENDMQVVGEASNGPEVQAVTADTRADILLLDISMPGTNGLSLLKDVLRLQPALRILILSMHPEDRFAIRAIREGAWGYLTKESAPEELTLALRRIASGRKYITARLAEKLADGLASDAAALPHELLSEREFEIFLLISLGNTVSEIAHELSLSVATISTHRRRILEKMNLHSNAEMIHYAYTNKLIQ